MEIWITGASGQIGAVLTTHLRHAGHRVTALGRTPPDQPDPPAWIPWDARSPDAVPEGFPRPGALVHLAGQTSAYVARHNPAGDLSLNVLAPLRLMESIATDGSRPIVLMAGAATVNDRVLEGAFTENPATFYETGKHALELYAAQLMREGRIRFASLRLSNVYGGRTSGQPNRGFLNLSVAAALRGEPLRCYGPAPCRRDYLHVTDAAEAFSTALKHADAVAGRVYPLGSGEVVPIRTVMDMVAEEVESAVGTHVPVLEIAPPDDLYPIELLDRRADASEFRTRTDWAPRVPLREGIRRLIRANLSIDRG